MDKDIIWALVSVENNYDQPPNNLVAYWFQKPTLDALAKVLNTKEWGTPDISDDQVLFVVNVWSGVSTEDGRTSYKLKQFNPGVDLGEQ